MNVNFKIIYNKTDITTDISSSLISLTYNDREESESDEISLVIEDTKLKWQNEWYPTKGDSLSVSFGYGVDLVDAGVFEIDEIEIEGPPDHITIKGLATGITKTLRTKRSQAYENKTLRQICTKIASRNNLSVQGDISDLQIERATQFRKTDLRFLKELSFKFGYVFSIRGDVITFTNMFDLEAYDSVSTIKKTDTKEYMFTDKTSETYKSANVSYKNPITGELVIGGVDVAAFAGKAYAEIEKLDLLDIREKAENKEQAEAISKSELYKKNSAAKNCNLTVVGNPFLLAGNNFDLEGFGVFDGKWHIMSSSHVISQAGFVSSISGKKIE